MSVLTKFDKLVRGIFGSFRRQFSSSVETDQSTKVSVGHTAEKPQSVVLIAPAYDFLTKMLEKWATEVANLDLKSCVLFLGRNASRDKLHNYFQSGISSDRVIFFGHGLPDAFLTAPELGHPKIEVDGKPHSVVLDTQFLPKMSCCSMLAFCCSAGATMGRKFLENRQSARFLGFSSLIFFAPDESSNSTYLKLPFTRAAANIIAGGNLSAELAETIRAEYKDSLNSLLGNAYQFDDIALMRHCIRSHVKALAYLESDS